MRPQGAANRAFRIDRNLDRGRFDASDLHGVIAGLVTWITDKPGRLEALLLQKTNFSAICITRAGPALKIFPVEPCPMVVLGSPKFT